MTDTKKLVELIDNSGLRINYIAKKLGITYQGLKNKIENKREFKGSEIFMLCNMLNINDYEKVTAIFFAHPVE